jgi:hypothetical protein
VSFIRTPNANDDFLAEFGHPLNDHVMANVVGLEPTDE